MSTGLMMLSNHLILCYPLLFLLSIFSSIRVFSKKLVLCIRWPKYWRFSFSISPSNEYSGLTSFRIDWFSLSAVWGTLNSLLQHNSKHCKFTNYFVCLSYLKLSIVLKYLIMIVDFLMLFFPLWSFPVHIFWDYCLKSQQFQNILIFLMDNSWPICIVILPLFPLFPLGTKPVQRILPSLPIHIPTVLGLRFRLYLWEAFVHFYWDFQPLILFMIPLMCPIACGPQLWGSISTYFMTQLLAVSLFC